MDNSSPQEIWCTLTGPVDQGMVQRVFNGFALAVQNKIETVHMLIQSTGGFVADGIALYNYLSRLPIEIITYNAGGVSSIAVTVFLSGKRRFASDTATFMIHSTHTSTASQLTASTLKRMAGDLEIDNTRTEKILRTHITMPPEKWAIHEQRDLTITAVEAKQFGLITDIADFAPPPGAMLHSI